MSNAKTSISIGWSTAPSQEEAERIARALVDRRLVACAQISGSVLSFYRWKGEVQFDEEFRLILKFTPQREAEVRDALRKLHPYDVPQWVVTHTDAGHEEYVAWVHDSGREDPV